MDQAPIDQTQNPPSVEQNGLPFVDETIENVSKSTMDYLGRHVGYVVAVIILTIVFEVLFALYRVSDPRLYIAPLFIPFFGYGWARKRVQHEFMQQFAAANGYAYAAKGSLDGLDGSIFQIGHSKSVVDVVSGQYKNCLLSLFTYTYVTGYGKSQQTHSQTIYELQFSVTLPDILLENATMAFGEPLFGKQSGKEFIKLEGDFNKYFSLSIPKGYEIEALEIFTPDVMEEFIDKAKHFSMEIVNGHLFIYDNGIIGTKLGLYDLYGFAQYCVEKLGPVLARMQPSLAASVAVNAG